MQFLKDNLNQGEIKMTTPTKPVSLIAHLTPALLPVHPTTLPAHPVASPAHTSAKPVHPPMIPTGHVTTPHVALVGALVHADAVAHAIHSGI
jgi:hypothetical protein